MASYKLPKDDIVLRNELASLEKLIKISDVEKKINSEIMKNVLSSIIEHIRLLNEFNEEMFRDVKYSGSYYEGLRIKEATEFDLNIVLAFPFIPWNDIKIDPTGCPESYAKLKIETQLEKIVGTKLNEDGIRRYKALMDIDQHFYPAKVKEFLKSVLAKVMPQVDVPGVKRIEFSESGPACTIFIHTTSGVKIDVDLVPVFRFPASDFPSWPNVPGDSVVQRCETERIRALNKHFFLVPKPYTQAIRQNPREPKTTEVPKLWRVHYPDEENSLLNNRKFAKPLIKLLKLLRDEEKWNPLKSYFLKTVVLYEIKKYNNLDDWQDKSSGKRFVGALESLQTYALKKKLPHIMFPSFNLFQNIGNAELEKIKNRIAKILETIKKDPSQLTMKYFKTLVNGACPATGCPN